MAESITEEISKAYQARYREILAYCICRLFRKDLADDATATVFLRFVQNYQSLRGKNEGEIRSWLYGTAGHVVADVFRNAARYREIMAEVAAAKGTEADHAAFESDSLDWPELYKAMSNIKPRYQEALALRYFSQLSSAEIEHALGMNAVAVRVLLWRAGRQLRKHLERGFGD